jgi:succinate dehydrogenase / fumarate reductase membrane anchor subunit
MSGSSGFKTDHNRARGLGAAKHGASHWLMERITSIALAPLSVWAVFAIVHIAPTGYEGAKAWLGHPLNAVLSSLLLAVGFQHMHAGMRVIIEDYIYAHFAKSALLLANLFVCVLAAALAIFAVLKVALTAGAL